jgi:hypothetical protein
MLVSQGKTGSNGNARNSGWRKRAMAMDLVFEGVLIDVLDRGLVNIRENTSAAASSLGEFAGSPRQRRRRPWNGSHCKSLQTLAELRAAVREGKAGGLG